MRPAIAPRSIITGVEGLIPVFIIVVFALVIVGAIFSAIQARKRREELTAWAQQHGLHFDQSRVHDFEHHYPEFKCLQSGSNRYAYNLITGQWGGRPIVCFDYHYETHSTDNKGRRQTHHHHFSAVIVASPLPLKPLFIRPEGFFDKITEFFGYDDIDFESAEFSRRFHVTSPDKRWAYDVLHQRTMQFLLDSPTYQIQFGHNAAIAYQGSCMKAAQFEAALGVIRGVLDGFPPYLKQQLAQGV